MTKKTMNDNEILALLERFMAANLPPMRFEILSDHYDDRTRFIGLALDGSLRVERTINFRYRLLHCSSTHLASSQRGRGIGRRVMTNSARLSRELGLDTMKIIATNEGRYAWARVGFQADNEFWFSAKEALLNTLKIDARFRNSTDLDLAIRIIDSNDPLALHYLTGLKNLVPVEAGGQNEMTSFGRALLTSVGSWRGEFDLTNKSYMQLLAGRR
ncbi:hypothetical protein [Agrobacterium pusense]|uniref:hypothetical protein n=1 Tax=Agrobacterium pusense TaxID=648995 RepID=UPI0022B8E0F3|nr:hypothetical protein [Agrobacterium pusense]MCZ7926914.1 hypothetical protein [Agrobacterium pusense]